MGRRSLIDVAKWKFRGPTICRQANCVRYRTDDDSKHVDAASVNLQPYYGRPIALTLLLARASALRFRLSYRPALPAMLAA
jgi:hypothetical protein